MQVKMINNEKRNLDDGVITEGTFSGISNIGAQ